MSDRRDVALPPVDTGIRPEESEILEVARKIIEEGLRELEIRHGANSTESKVFHSPEHTKTLLNRAKTMADVFGINPEQRSILEMAITYHDMVVDVERQDASNPLSMVARCRGAKDGDIPKGKDGNEARSAQLLIDRMREMNTKSGRVIFTEEHMSKVRTAIEATYPGVNLGSDYSGAKFNEDKEFEVCMKQNPSLLVLIEQLESDNITKGPLFFQPHLESALEAGSVSREALVTALADLGGAGMADYEEFKAEGNAEFRELYANLRRKDVFDKIANGDESGDIMNRKKAVGKFVGWIEGQVGFTTWQAIRFKKIVGLLRNKNQITTEEEKELRSLFGHFEENIRSALQRSNRVKAKVTDLIGSDRDYKEAFRYVASDLGYEFQE